MPVIAGNLVVTHADQVQEVEAVNERPVARSAQLISDGVAAHPREAVLIVNGKEKRIGRKSQYLLDMLSLEE